MKDSAQNKCFYCLLFSIGEKMKPTEFFNKSFESFSIFKEGERERKQAQKFFLIEDSHL